MRSCGLFVTEQSENNLRDTYVYTRELFIRVVQCGGGGEMRETNLGRGGVSATVPNRVDINYSGADEQFIGVIIVYHHFRRRGGRAEIFQKFRSIVIAARYSISLTMLEPLRELSAAQFPSFELIVEQSMFKLYYVPSFRDIDRCLNVARRVRASYGDTRLGR